MQTVFVMSTSSDGNTMSVAALSTEELKAMITNAVSEALGYAPPPAIGDKKLYTRKEAANYFSITLKTLDNWTRAGRVIAQRVGVRRIMYKAEDLQNALQQMKAGGLI